MKVFHITPDGVKPCRATKRKCPVSDHHFENVSDAEDAFRDLMGGSFGSKSVAEKNFHDLFPSEAPFNEVRYREKSENFLGKLTDEETEALHLYVHVAYDELNKSLYNEKNLKKSNEVLIHSIDSALTKAPLSPQILWRNLSGRDLPREFLKKNHRVGEIVVFSGFTSTSETADALYGFQTNTDFYMNDTPSDEWETYSDDSWRVKPSEEYTARAAMNMIFRIKTNRAAPVSTLRTTVNEQEWLLPRNGKFRITEIHPNVNIGKLKSAQSHETRAQIFEIEEISS